MVDCRGYMMELHTTEDITLDMKEWRSRIRVEG